MRAIVVLAACASGFRNPRALTARPRRAAVPQPRRVAARMTSMPELALACTVPTCLGFWKREYGVSYAYGLSIAAAAALVLGEGPASPIAVKHCWAHIAYGTRLCAFLFWRELTVPRFREFREKIEMSAPAGGRRRRAPFILGCSFLYFAMSVPLVMSARAPEPTGATRAAAAALANAAWFGFWVAALGDAWKYLAKASRGASVLVTGGPYAVLRHPNYQGEQLLWAASAALGVAVAPTSFLSIAAAVVGCAGIQFVLMQATTGLNARQDVEYANWPAFNAWRAWRGFELPKPRGYDDDRGYGGGGGGPPNPPYGGGPPNAPYVPPTFPPPTYGGGTPNPPPPTYRPPPTAAPPPAYRPPTGGEDPPVAPGYGGGTGTLY
jgi:steroid 5-alpha reductase family enzyme